MYRQEMGYVEISNFWGFRLEVVWIVILGLLNLSMIRAFENICTSYIAFSSDDVVSVDSGWFRPLSAAGLAPAAVCGWSCAAEGWRLRWLLGKSFFFARGVFYCNQFLYAIWPCVNTASRFLPWPPLMPEQVKAVELSERSDAMIP